MKIAFTSDEKKGLDSVMSYHFGHCPYFVIVEVSDNNIVKKVENIENSYSGEHNPGELPAFMHSLGINMIVTGGMGPKAQEFFTQYGVEPVIGTYGKIEDVLKEVLHGEIKYEETPQREHIDISNESKENEEQERLKLEVQDLRRQVAEIKSIMLELKEKIER